jgi:hypothetical protein
MNCNKSSIDELQARGELFTRQLIKEKQRAVQLQVNLDEVKAKIATLRESNKQKAMLLFNKYATTPNDAHHRVDGLNPAMLAENNQKKIVKKMEGSLSKALTRRNRIENENESIKGKIDVLRRKVYSDIKNKECMKKELVEIKEEVDGIMKRAADATSGRERLIERRNQAIQQGAEKQAAFEKEYNELCLRIAEKAKSLEQSIAETAEDVTAKLRITEAGEGANIDITSDEVADIKQLKDKAAALDKQYEETLTRSRENQSKIEQYEEHFEQLREVSGLTSTEDIVRTFVKNEDECFSMFNYIQVVNQDCDRIMEQSAKLREEVNQIRKEQMDTENTRSATLNVYRTGLDEVKEEREKLYETAIESRRTIETIAQRVTALYFKLKCNELDLAKQASRDSTPPQQRVDIQLTTIGGGVVSERNIVNLMELIETRSIQIVDAYLKQLSTTKRPRRSACLFLVSLVQATSSPLAMVPAHRVHHSFLQQSPKMIEQAITKSKQNQSPVEESEEEEETSSSDDDDDQEIRQPMSVNDIRREAAGSMKPGTAIPTRQTLTEHQEPKRKTQFINLEEFELWLSNK